MMQRKGLPGPTSCKSASAPSSVLTLCAVVLALTAATQLRAQATPATGEQKIRLQAFAVASYVRPDYNVNTSTNIGGAAGADANFRVKFLGRAQPGAEVRYADSTGNISRQSVFSGGTRVLYPFGRFQPYADFLVGYGTIRFKVITIPNFTQDDSIVYTYGGGTDYNLTRAWAIRADVQASHWQITHSAPPFHPLAISAGIRYQFHFRNQNGPE